MRTHFFFNFKNGVLFSLLTSIVTDANTCFEFFFVGVKIKWMQNNMTVPLKDVQEEPFPLDES